MARPNRGLPPATFAQASNYLSTRFQGKTIDEVQRFVREEMAQLRSELDEISARIPDRERERVRASLMDLVITGNSYEVEFPVLSADGGRERIVAAQGILHRNERGEPEKVSGVVQDVTDLRRKERELEEKNAELERFVYLVSHDLKSPLVTIKTFLGYLEQDVARGETDQAAKS